MRRAALLLGLLAVPAAAKPILVRVDDAIAAAGIVAEVQVLAVQPAQRPGGGWIRVRVTDDPRRIFRGARFCGAELTLRPPPSGRVACTRELDLRRRPWDRVLLVVDARHVVRIAAYRVGDDYVLHGWSDHSLCLMWCSDRQLGHRLGELRFRVFRPTLRERYAEEEAAFWALVARHAMRTIRPLPVERLKRLIAYLGAADRGRRDLAHRLLLERGAFSIPALREAKAHTADPEQRRRIRAVLEGLADHARAVAVARGLTDPKRKAWIVRAALPRLSGAEREAAERYLLQPDPDAKRDADDDEHDD